jgi:putative alpha-1,2-mannosidase
MGTPGKKEIVMKRNFLTFILAGTIFCSCNQQPAEDLVKYVNPLVGTPWKGDGGTLPVAGLPFAMTTFVPTTNLNCIGSPPYHYEMNEIIGFMGTHQPCVWMGDYGFVSFWPSVNKVNITVNDRKFKFSHDKEKSTPYFYSVEMTAKDTTKKVNAEFSATTRCGIFSFDMKSCDTAYVVVEASRNKGSNYVGDMFSDEYMKEVMVKKEKFRGYVEVNPEKGEICGYNPEWHSFNIGPELKNLKGYFIVKFEKPFYIYGTWKDSLVSTACVKDTGKWIGAFAGFIENKDHVTFKVGTSFISLDQARENLEKEIPDWDIEKVKTKVHDEWQKKLEVIKIKGTEDQKYIFYTGMYHALLLPREFSEYGKYYSAFDDTIHNGISYNDYSLWDTYRAEHPLLLFIAPERVPGMINSLLQSFDEGGWLPKWPNPSYSSIMIGTHADAVIADALVKGVKGIDLQKAYQAVRKDAFVPPVGDTGNNNYVPSPWKGSVKPKKLKPGQGNPWWDRGMYHGYEARAGLTWYMKLGYVPAEMTYESVSNTLEGAYDDYCVAQVAKMAGKTDDYNELMRRTKNYKNVYDTKTGFMNMRLTNGKFVTDQKELDPTQYMWGFTEGLPYTYLFCTMQDMPGAIEMMGGKEKFVEKLDSNFAGGHYVHSNEPGHHYTYLYDYAGVAWKTQEKVRRYTLSQYKNAPAGLDGNDDCGQMSAWYIFSAMGFYPVCPGSNEYAIGSPLLPEAVIKLPNGKKLTIIANNVSDKNCYIQKLSLNGKEILKPFITHEQLLEGGELVFEMSNVPNKDWGK